MRELSGTEKLQSEQLVTELPGTQKLQSLQLVPEKPGTATESQSQPAMQATGKRERQHRPAGIVENQTPGERQVKKEQELPVVPPGYLVAFAHKLRYLHYVGRCWRKPGRDIKNWQYYGQEQPGEEIMIITANSVGTKVHFQDKTLSRGVQQKTRDLLPQTREQSSVTETARSTGTDG